MRATQAFTSGARIHPKNLTIFGEPRKRKNKRHRRNASLISEARQKRGFFSVEQATGIGPANYAWEAYILPLNYACKSTIVKYYHKEQKIANIFIKIAGLSL